MSPVERRLLELVSQLDDQDQRTLLAFAEFLAAGGGAQESTGTVGSGASAEVPEPAHVPRDENESVVGAIKRLSQRYYMLDRRHMLDKTSTLMAQHVMEGRDAQEVIKELEEAFESAYQRLIEDKDAR